MKKTLCLSIAVLFFLPTAALGDTFSILAFGDSITAGLKRDAADNEWGITSPPQGARVGGYEPPLESIFSKNTDHTAYVYNWGRHGELTQDGVNRIDSVLSSRNAQFLLLMEGANDIIHGVSQGTVKFNLGVMINKIRARNVEPVLATITPQSGNNVTSWNSGIAALAVEKNVLLADQYSAIISNFGLYNSGDGLHISTAGDDKMADTWLTILENSLPGDTVNLPGDTVNMAPIIQFLLD